MDLIRNKLFKNVEQDIVNLIEDNAILKKCLIKEEIYSQNMQENRDLHIVKSGVLVISKIDFHGFDRFLYLKKTNDIFGAVSLIDNGPRIGKTVALSNCEYWTINNSFIKKYLLNNSAFTLNLMNIFIDEIRQFHFYRSQVSGRSAQKKILFYLLDLVDISDNGTIGVIHKYINQSILSGFTGLARETISREINKLKKMNVITTENKDKIELDIKRCKDLLKK